MDAGEQLKVAGEAAELLEEMGFTSVARMRDGAVTLELWRVIGGRQRVLRHALDGTEPSARALAGSCAAMFRSAVARDDG